MQQRLLSELEKKESKKLKSFQKNITKAEFRAVCRIRANKARAVQVEETGQLYLKIWESYLDNHSGKIKSASPQIEEQHKTTIRLSEKLGSFSKNV